MDKKVNSGIINVKGLAIGKGKPVICVPVMAADKEEIVKQILDYAGRGIEMIEWRVDAFSEVGNMDAIEDVLEKIKDSLEKTALVYTYRSKEQGGLGGEDAVTVKKIHITGAKSEVVDFVDLEYFATNKPEAEIKEIQSYGTYVIASHHDFDETPESGVISILLDKMNESGSDIVKLAVMPKDIDDVLTILKQTSDFVKRHPDKPIITMSMGKTGSISRIAGQYFGSCVTFGSAEASSAPGQMPYKNLSVILDTIDENLK